MYTSFLRQKTHLETLSNVVELYMLYMQCILSIYRIHSFTYYISQESTVKYIR